MTKKKDEYQLTPFWQEIADITQEPDFQGEGQGIKVDGDSFIYNKLLTFLYRGAVGTLYEIKEALGKEQLDLFLNYIYFYINNSEKPGHYYPSQLVRKQIEEIKQTKDLFDLKDTLNEISRLEFEKHGVKNVKGWLFDENRGETKST
ncbi:hypothetical protein [Lactobacillus huangpiensis]|uniref:hypothetical protein n=1 Tax=Lactobacillus huangpiensis TaxID=2799571 RepID=UPI001CC3DBC0|nr:hypothetical protein [Lactobacillus huangpiensis]